MCVVSMIGDDFSKRYKDVHPWVEPYVVPVPTTPTYIPNAPGLNVPSMEEFLALKKEVEALKDLLKAAKIYDEKTGQPECHKDEKVELIKKIAELVGVDMEDVL